MDISTENFGRYLRELRFKSGMTQRQAAHKAGISASYIAQIEQGKREPPSREVLTRIAAAYEASVRDILRRAAENRFPADGSRSLRLYLCKARPEEPIKSSETGDAALVRMMLDCLGAPRGGPSTTTNSTRRIEWAFEAVCRDPALSPGLRESLVRWCETVAGKREVVDLYQVATGRRLLTLTDLAGVLPAEEAPRPSEPAPDETSPSGPVMAETDSKTSRADRGE